MIHPRVNGSKFEAKHTYKDSIAQEELILVGLTDSDDLDSFTVEKIKGKFVFKYNIHQPLYNLRLLYYIKKKLGYGKVIVFESRQLACFTISDIEVLKEKIFTVFDKYALLTSKYFYYLRFKKALCIIYNKGLTIEQKNESVEFILNISLPSDYVSPAISHLSDKSSIETIKSTVTKYWLVGFIEGKGNLHVLFEQGVFNVEFSIYIKDKILLNSIKRIFHIPNKVIIPKQWLLRTQNSRAISNIIDFFSVKGGNSKFKGMKSLIFKLWKKAFYYKKIDIKKVAKIHRIMLKFNKG